MSIETISVTIHDPQRAAGLAYLRKLRRLRYGLAAKHAAWRADAQHKQGERDFQAMIERTKQQERGDDDAR